MTDALLVSTTWPTPEAAQAFAAAAVTRGLVACAQVHGPIESTYRWEGRVERATEWACHCKTIGVQLRPLEALLRQLHPYQVPELVATPIIGGAAGYLAWVTQTAAPGPAPPEP